MYAFGCNQGLQPLYSWMRCRSDPLIVLSHFLETSKNSVLHGRSLYMIHGAMKQNRTQIIEEMCKNPRAVSLLTVKSGGVGLNLQSFNAVILVNRLWCPAVRNSLDILKRIRHCSHYLVNDACPAHFFRTKPKNPYWAVFTADEPIISIDTSG